MHEDETHKMANQFIGLWQDNFARTMQDPEIMQQFVKAMGFMQQFYGQGNFHDKSATDAASAPSGAGDDELCRQQLRSRIEELEARIAKLESKPGGKRSKKKVS